HREDWCDTCGSEIAALLAFCAPRHEAILIWTLMARPRTQPECADSQVQLRTSPGHGRNSRRNKSKIRYGSRAPVYLAFEVDTHSPSRMRSAARSAMASTVALVLADGMDGMTDASATRRPARPWTRSSRSTTAPVSGSVPMRHVPTGWKYVFTLSRT